MKTIVLLILFLSSNILSLWVNSQCTEYYQDNQIEGVIQIQRYDIDLKNQKRIGIGFWMSYRPQDDYNTPLNPEVVETLYKKELFIFSFEQADTQAHSITLFADIFLEEKKISHNIILSSISGTQILNFPMDYDNYEGIWIFFYCLIDKIESSVSVNHYNLRLEESNQQIFFGHLLLYEDMITITGGYKNIEIDPSLTYHFQTYPGYLLPVILKFEDYYLSQSEDFIRRCKPQPICGKNSEFPIGYNSMVENFIQKKYELRFYSYSVQGWIKQDPLISSQRSIIVLFRISGNKNYLSDNSQVGDKILYVTYYQDPVNLNQNGFSLQTYSYSQLWKPNNYLSDEFDIIYVQDEKYKNLLTQWHYFQFEFGTSSNNGQPIYKVYYAGADIQEEYKWKKNINHFTSQNLYFIIGGDEYSLHQFQGYLSNWIFTQFCDVEDVSFIPKCHYSCQSCKGISEKDCTSCDEQSFRVYSESQHTCQCMFGYIDKLNEMQCLGISHTYLEFYQYHGAFHLIENELAFKDEGYYKYQQCEFGYFPYNNSCLKCPYSVQDNLIRCADCILYPIKFSENLNCTFQFNSTDKFSIFNYYSLNTQEYELFKIINFNQKYQLKKKIGHQNDSTCKEGYFLSENDECQECIVHCLKCNNEFSCHECEQRYIQKDDVCIECQNCAYKYLDYYDAGIGIRIYCPKSMYRKDEMCYDCGNHCMACSEDSCYYCEDKSNYFITLDQKNCAECPIKNCQYCFQYYINSDQTIITSLDLDKNYKLKEDQIITGCALCENGYFYSLVTFLCETKPSDMTDCQTGVYVDNQGSTKCLISQTRYDAVQQNVCSDKLCLSCINNYSQHIQSFCIICKDGYYSSFSNGQCKKCPSNCLTCAEFNQFEKDQWKWSIRAFYNFFINQNNTHPFEIYSVSSLNILCLSCYPNFELNEYICVQVCDEDCLDCQKQDDPQFKYQFKCNKCKTNTFNLQRSVDQNNISQCLSCPNYCAACIPRISEDITALNHFFNQTSPFLKYSHICYQPELIHQEGTISNMPLYNAPNVCQKYNQCENKFNVLYDIYCDEWAYFRAYLFEPNIYRKSQYHVFKSIILENTLLNFFTIELFHQLNQARITEIEFDMNIFFFENNDECQLFDDDLNITNYSKQNIFTLQNSSIIFHNSNASSFAKLPLKLKIQFQLINFNKIVFAGIQFKTLELEQLYSEPIANLTFINDYDPVTLQFKDCEIVQYIWFKFFRLTFASKIIQQLLIQKMNMETLQLSNSSVFNLQPSKYFQNVFQQIDQLFIHNSNFTNSSIFIYNSELYSLHQVVQFTNVTISNTNFTSSFFINSSTLLDNTIGEIYLENFHLENLILQDNSVFFQIFGATKLFLKNFTIVNVIFQDYSSLIVCNILNINEFFIYNSIIKHGYFINVNQKTSDFKNIVTTKEISCININFVNNTYSSESVNSFIYILQEEFTIYEFFCMNLLLDNNVLANSNIGKQSQFIHFSQKFSLIYIQCNKCTLRNLTIYRGIGLPEISIINSKQLEITNFYIETREQYYKRSLHSSADCSKRFIYQDIPFVLYIWSYQDVEIEKAIIQNTIIADYSIIILLGKIITESVQEETISVSNLVIKNNLLLILNQNKQTSIISIETQQVSSITIKNVEFYTNLLNQYYQNSLLHSSTTLLINAKQGKIILQYLLFNNNIITNSSDSVLYILSNSLEITNCNFLNQNILTDAIFKKNIISQYHSILEYRDVVNCFQILSSGGNGYIETNYLLIENAVIKNSLAINGGGFFITTISDGIVWVTNCTFENISTVLNGNQLASGGLFYIDSSKSSLNFTISNCSIKSAYSRAFGGAIYIEPSRASNLICVENSSIFSVFSIQHSFLSFSPKKQIDIESRIILNNLKFQNPVEEFEKFVYQLTDIQKQNILLFQTENPFIYAQFSNFTIIDCQFDKIHLASLLEIQQAIDISLKGLQIFNCTIFQSPIIKLSLKSGTKGIIQIQNLFLSNLIQYSQAKKQDCNLVTKMYLDLLCPDIITDINLTPNFALENEQSDDNQLNCNLNLLYQIIQSQTFSVIELNQLNDNHYIYINDLIMEGVICDDCKYGILNVKQFDQILNLQILNINIINNFCGTLGCLSIIKSINESNQSTTGVSKISDNVIDKIAFYTTIKNSAFINNTAQYGGACYLTQIDILINNTKFQNNKALLYGGSIYYDSNQTTLLILNSLIVKNKAKIGGAIYLQNQQIQRLDNLNLVIKDNIGFSFANNVYEAPRFLYLSLDQMNPMKNIQLFSNSTTIIEQISIPPYLTYLKKKKTDVLLLPSGISISSYYYFNSDNNSYTQLNQSLRLLAMNVFNEKITNIQNTACQISAYTINSSKSFKFDNFIINNSDNTQYISQQSILFNMETGDYNLDDLIIYFNPFQDKTIQLQLAFQCNSIKIPYYNTQSNLLSNFVTNYILLLNLRTFECQLGEYFNETSGGCALCDISQSQYSVTINSTQCSYKDETKISDIEPAMIKLRPSYWRAFYFSENIEICHNLLANCEGGWFAGNPSCATGHIGALCEQCDIYNIKGSGEYSQNQSYQCSSCDQSANNILNIVFVIVWTLISVFVTVKSTIQMIDDYLFQLKLKPLGFYTVHRTASTSALLKVFTNYFQIVSSIASFQLSIPLGIALAVRGVGNPIGSVAFSLDCYLKNFSSISIIYLRIIWGFAMAGMYIFLFFLFHISTIVFQKKNFNITFVTTTFIYIYIYLSPNLVSELSSLISYRNISGQQWIAANVAYLYNSQLHKVWLIYFVTPTFLVIGILLPYFFWYIVYHHRLTLNSTKTRKFWGYLYNEYKLSVYYWETIKIIQKELIILILIYYEDYVAIKACLIFFLLDLYSKLTIKFRPYLTENLNRIDSLSTSICKISIVIAWSIYSAQSLDIQEVVWPLYLVLAIINCYFIFEMISKLIFAYFYKLQDHIDQLKGLILQKLPSTVKNNRFCLRLLQNTSERKQIIRSRFQQVRKYLLIQAKQIITLKSQNNMGLQSFPPKLHSRLSYQNSKFGTMVRLKSSSEFL